MANRKGSVEVQDLLGSTKHYSGTVGTSPVAIPTVADKVIAEVWIESDPTDTPVNKTLSFSLDGGVTYTDLGFSEGVSWNPKGKIDQVYIKGSTSSVKYRMIINYEDIPA